jgi:hypothetical protein
MINVWQIKSEEPLTPFAPVYNYYICTADLSKLIDFKDIKYTILGKEKSIIEQYKANLNDAYTELGNDSLTSRFAHYNIFNWPEMYKLKSAVKTIHDLFLQYIKVENRPVWINGWANVMRKGQHIKTHIHNVDQTCYLGGHICVDCEQSSTFYINPVNTINDPEIFEIENKIGQLTLFSNCIPHYTSIHEGNSERITMAFNLNVVNKNNNNIQL